jgi:hypothetical protein
MMMKKVRVSIVTSHNYEGLAIAVNEKIAKKDISPWDKLDVKITRDKDGRCVALLTYLIS